jgi:hypothetical protein
MPVLTGAVYADEARVDGVQLYVLCRRCAVVCVAAAAAEGAVSNWSGTPSSECCVGCGVSPAVISW